MQLSLQEIADKLGAELDGDGSICINGLAGLRQARSDEIAFMEDAAYASHVSSTQAGAVIVPSDFDGASSSALLRSTSPRSAFWELVPVFSPPPVVPKAGIHPTAYVSPDATVADDVHVGPCAVIEAGARVGAGSRVGAGTYLGDHALIGADVLLYPNVTIREYCEVGDRTIVHSGAVIGGDGFGYDVDTSGPVPIVAKIPQLGIVVIGTDVEVGSNAAIDRACFGATRIGNHVKIDNLVQVGHNTRIGDYSGLIAQTGIAGSSLIGSGVTMWGQTAMSGHVSVGDGSTVYARGVVTKDIPPGSKVLGFPAMDRREELKRQASLGRVPELRTKVKELERRLADLESGSDT